MKAISITANTPQKIQTGGNYDFLHILNNSGATIYICYDGDPSAEDPASGMHGAPPDTSTQNTNIITNGWQLPDGGFKEINNDGPRQLFRHNVWVTCGSNVTIYTQGN